MSDRILIGTGYKLLASGELETLALDVCDHIATIHFEYDYVLLPGGWHGNKKAPRTISSAMRDKLVRLGVPTWKLIIRDNVMPELRPATDLIEEVDTVPHLLKAIDFDNPRVPLLDTVCASWMMERQELLYRSRRANLGTIHTVPSRNLLRILAEQVAMYATKKSPEGDNWIIQRNRKGRIVSETQPNGQPWILPTPDAWRRS